MAPAFVAPVHISKTPRSQAACIRSSCFTGSRLVQHVPVRRVHAISMKIGIYFATMMGATEEAAEAIKEVIGDDAENPVDIENVDAAEFTKHELIFVGAPTWNTGADTERSSTAWDTFLYDELPSIDMSNVPVAVFGLGDSVGYGENFCDAIEELYDCFAKQGARMVGHSTTEYEYMESKSVRDGKFLGLPLDATNFPDDIEDVLKGWVLSVIEETGIAVPLG